LNHETQAILYRSRKLSKVVSLVGSAANRNKNRDRSFTHRPGKIEKILGPFLTSFYNIHTYHIATSLRARVSHHYRKVS